MRRFWLGLLPLFLWASQPAAEGSGSFEMSYFYDESNTQGPETVIREGRFVVRQNPLSINNQKGTHWFKIVIRNTTDDAQERIVSYSENLLNSAIFYEMDDSGRVLKRYETGLGVMPTDRMIQHSRPAYGVLVEAGQAKTVLLQAQSSFPMVGLLRAQSPEEFTRGNAYVLYFYIFCFGVAFSMIVYNLFIFLFHRERVYLYYVFYLSVFSLFIFHQSGLMSYYLDAEGVERALVLLPIAFMVFMMFTRELLQDEIPTRTFQRLIRAYFTAFTVAATAFLIDIRLAVTLMQTAVISFFPFAFYLFFQGKTKTKLYLLALSFYLVSMASMALIIQGVIPYNELTRNINAVGAMIETMLLSVILANRMNVLKQEKLEMQQNVLEMQQNMLALQAAQNETLQTKVAEQTRALKLLFQELHHRVKNNFQFILTFLWVKKKSLKDPTAIAAFDVMDKRIRAVSLMHELLYAKEDAAVDFRDYMERFLTIFREEKPGVCIECQIEPLALSFDAAVTLGLILNELITNSFKYAFENTAHPWISIALRRGGDGAYLLEYDDNGPGFDPAILKENPGLGYELIGELTRKLRGALMTLSTRNGVSIVVRFDGEVDNA